MGRRLARELALKILYRYEEGDSNLPEVIHAVLAGKKCPDADKDFSENLVQSTIKNLAKIDEHIVQVLENWPFDRIALIDKIILRLGTCEILYFDDIPSEVSINEAIELGKKYGGGDSSRFVNGILDAVRKKYESGNNK